MPNTEQDDKSGWKQELADLERVRDELRVQMHLAGAEARDAWDKMERKWEQIENELGLVGEHAKAPLKELGKATRGVLDELKQGYTRIRSKLSE